LALRAEQLFPVCKEGPTAKRRGCSHYSGPYSVKTMAECKESYLPLLSGKGLKRKKAYSDSSASFFPGHYIYQQLKFTTAFMK